MYENWNDEILQTLTKLKEIDNNPIYKSLFGGFYIFDSNYILTPDFFIISINSGNENPNNSEKVVTKPQNKFSYRLKKRII